MSKFNVSEIDHSFKKREENIISNEYLHEKNPSKQSNKYNELLSQISRILSLSTQNTKMPHKKSWNSKIFNNIIIRSTSCAFETTIYVNKYLIFSRINPFGMNT